MHTYRLLAPLMLTSLAGICHSQGFDNRWLVFENDDSRLIADPSLGIADTEEKDYACGDFDRNGLTDLVVVRKEPLHTTGARPNVLFLNLNGVLTDVTARFAAASDVAGDAGFLTATNDRDVVATDVDMDGWLDVVTATTLSPGQPKEISHPRVYRNLGEDAQGRWRGFCYEAARIPQLLLADGTPSWPRFTALAAGDVTGDGYPDLYFGDNDKIPALGGGDMGDRLLINDGAGFFVDESSLRIASTELSKFFSTSAQIEDMNLDGTSDILRDRGYFTQLSTAYNDPLNEGFFSVYQDIINGSPYYATAGDLNRDGRPDMVVSDNGNDRFRLNEGNLPGGEVQWSSHTTFDFLTGGDDGYGSDSYIVDLDDDGWNDVVICDFDVELPGCNRRLHVYHNAGGAVGGPVALREEAEMQSGGWRGAVGLIPSQISGVHDVGIFDLDGDGDLDMVLGKCTGTKVYLNQRVVSGPLVGTLFCDCDGGAPCGNPGDAMTGCANSTGGGAIVRGYGSNSVGADDLYLRASGLVPGQPGLAFVGTQTLAGGTGLPFGDGLHCVGGSIVRLGVRVPDSGGHATWGPSLAALGGWTAGDSRHFQVWYRDPVGPCGSGFNLTSALRVVFKN